MRATIHLVSARDCLALHGLTLPVLARAFKSSFSRQIEGADVERVAAAGRELLAAGPLHARRAGRRRSRRAGRASTPRRWRRP